MVGATLTRASASLHIQMVLLQAVLLLKIPLKWGGGRKTWTGSRKSQGGPDA